MYYRIAHCVRWNHQKLLIVGYASLSLPLHFVRTRANLTFIRSNISPHLNKISSTVNAPKTIIKKISKNFQTILARQCTSSFLSQLLRTHHYAHPAAIRKLPGGISFNLLTDADRSLGSTIRSRTLYIRQELCRFAKQLLLLATMRTPESSVKGRSFLA